MKRENLFTALLCLSLAGCSTQTATLKEAFAGKFHIGAALNANQFTGKDTAAVRVIKEHFSAIVAENCMKSQYLQPAEGVFDFTEADRFVAFGEENNLFVTGHTLIWHSQAPRWFFTDGEGNDVSREVMIERMRNHITTVVSRYKGRVKGWDVVNEAILDDGSMRETGFYRIIGPDYIRLAFAFAHQADPEAELYYNDFSMANAAKRQGVVNMVQSLKEEGIRIDGIGMQAHLTMQFPPVAEFEKSLLAFSGLGVKVMITELDLSVLPRRENGGADIALDDTGQQDMNPYTEGLPPEKEMEWAGRYMEFFKLFLKHRDKISRVTTWGISDSNSWLNNWPMPGRTDYALLFDRNYRAKPLVTAIIEESKSYR